MYASPGVVVNGAKPLAHEILPGDVVEIPANDTLTLHPSGDQVKIGATFVGGIHQSKAD